MSASIQVSKSWIGFEGLRYLMIFGDSYSAVGLDMKCDHPYAQEPLGATWPGIVYNEHDQPNWVGYILSKYRPGPKFDPSAKEQTEDYLQNPLLVFDFARGGATMFEVHRQIEADFLQTVGKSPENAPWQALNALFSMYLSSSRRINCPSQSLGSESMIAQLE
ncbi:hypothetical protein HGRIS_012797 [Hohenbuehelia grisea]|uniref:Uncharacterized protein n=1 Tax=Hohenbuehelia grisea TaxID=104357 RepID=A0ABR3ITH9_9AGAR